MSTIKQLLQFHHQKKGKKEIARLMGISRNTVKKYLNTFSSLECSIEDLLKKQDHELEKLLRVRKPKQESTRYNNLIDRLEYYKGELKRKYVTREQLWIEYRKVNPDGYRVTRHEL